MYLSYSNPFRKFGVYLGNGLPLIFFIASWHNVLFSYRTRIHSTTQQTPIAMVTGQEANKFEAWTTEPSKSVIELEERAKRLKTLLEDTRPKTIRTVSTHQEQQKIRQDKLHNIQREFLPIGTTVYIKSMRMQSKMAPLYHGPYTIVKRTVEDTYQLKTIENVLLPKFFPLCQLKVVQPLEDTIISMEKILDHKRTRRGQLEYLVQYSGKPIEDAQWIKEAHFTTTDIIEDYWHKQTSDKSMVLLTRKFETSQYRHPRWTTFTLFVYSLIMLWMSYPCQTQKLEGNFKLCDTQHKLMVKTKLKCAVNPVNDKNTKTEPEFWHLFQRQHLKIKGTAWICKKFKIQVVTDTGFFGHSSLSVQSLPEHISARECEFMVRAKKCDDYNMVCNDNSCYYQVSPLPVYRWMQTMTVTRINCLVKNTFIRAVDDTVTLFEGIKGACHANDLSCPMLDGIIIWDKKIIHKCDLQYIESGWFTRSNNIIYTSNKVNTTLKSTATHLLFQLETVDTTCQVSGYNTSQGLWVTSQRINVRDYDIAPVDSTMIEHLTLSDSDYSWHILEKNTQQVNVDQAYSQCQLLQSILNLLELNEDTFHTIYDLNGDSLITYTVNANLYVPRCTPISTIYLLNNSDKCFLDIPVLIYDQNTRKNFTAFLTYTGLLRKTSKLIKCANRNIEINIENKYLLKVSDKIVELWNYPTDTYTFQSHKNKWIKNSYQHDHKFVEEMAFSDHSDSLIPYEVDGKMVKVVQDTPVDNINWIGWEFSSLSDLKIKFTIIISLVILLIFMICVIGYSIKHCRRNRSQHSEVLNWINRRPD